MSFGAATVTSTRPAARGENMTQPTTRSPSRGRSARRRSVGIVLGILLLFAGAAGAQNLPDLFNQGRQAFQQGRYAKSLQIFNEVDAISRKPDFEPQRHQLEAPLHFFRAANMAMLKKRSDAVNEFLEFLRLNPQAALKEGSYPRPILAAFSEARRQFDAGGAALAMAYQSFLRADTGQEPAVDASWGESAVRSLFTDDEQRAWKATTSDPERRSFVDTFWQQRDPTPGTPANELRQELEARMRFADAQWSAGDTRGRDTDRALVFTLLGPPSSMDVQDVGAHDIGLANQRAQHSTGTGTRFGSGADSQQREIWVYKGDSVPGYLGERELKYTFFVRRGKAVLETSGRGYRALDEVAQHVDQSRVLR